MPSAKSSFLNDAPTRAQRLAPLALVSVAVVWGAAFVLMKDALVNEPIPDFLGTRFVLAASVMLLARPGTFKKLRGPLLWRGLILGLLLATAYYTQSVGLELTTAAIAGFVTGLYVVLCPLLIWLFMRKRVAAKVWIAVAMATAGLAFISIDPAGFHFEWPQLWLVVCALFFALHIVGLARWSPGADAYALTVVQLAVMGVVNLGWAIPRGYVAPVGFSGWFAIVFTAVFSTAIAFFVQTWAQGIMDSSRVAIYLTSETVFTALIAVGVGQEVLKGKTVIGGVLILLAMLVVEWPSRKNRVEIPLETMPH
jgi:drug/metabolite transporter (DMT)-like permease